MRAPGLSVVVAALVRRKDPGWLKRLLRRYESGPVLAVGFPVGTNGVSIKYPDGTPVLMVAAVNQFGSVSRGIPQRDFMTPGAVKAVDATRPIAEALVPALNAGKTTAADILTKMGPFAAASFQDAVTELRDPPNAQATIDAKGSDNPLIDTGLMRQSLTWAVRTK